jgi:ribosomal protein L11 methyltransferase
VVRTYVPPDDAARRTRLEEGLWYLSRLHPIPEASIRELAAANWAEAWKADYRPLRIGRSFLIVPSWCEAEIGPEDLVITLDPGMAFGTGLHPTTQLCLVAVEGIVEKGARVLDVGTGSGILAIAAALCGGEVWACDTDPVAVQTATENAAANHVDVTVTSGGIDQVPAGRFDFIVANILAPVIERLAPELAGRLVPGGTLVVSGILAEQADSVAAALETAGLALVGRDHAEDWVALRARDKSPRGD